jgi:hypothetical protein
MSTACLIGRPTGPAAMEAVYRSFDGDPSAMVPVLRRLVLDTFAGDPAAAMRYLFDDTRFRYWSSLTGSGTARSSATRPATPYGPIDLSAAARWPGDADVYQNHPDGRPAVLAYRDRRYVNSALLHWPQQWLYIVYPKVLAVVRYVPPTERLDNRSPLASTAASLPGTSQSAPPSFSPSSSARTESSPSSPPHPRRDPRRLTDHIPNPHNRGHPMIHPAPSIEKPAPVTDAPTIAHKPSSRSIEALWPLRSIHSEHDGAGVEYAVLSVSHHGSRRAYFASLNREEHFPGSVRVKPFDAARVGGLIPVTRFGQKSLQAAFAEALQTLRSEISAGDEKLVSYFTPSEGDTF